MGAKDKPGAGKYDPGLPVWEDERQPEMLMIGLSLADTLRTAKLELDQNRSKRRTLDDMRRLSEHIKKVPVYAKK